MPTHDGNEVFAVTGATSGVGRAVVRELARPGRAIGVLARGPDGLAATREEIEALGARVAAVPTDVSSWPDVDHAARKVEDELGPIDVWVNDAMTTVFSPFEEIGPDEFEHVTAVDYLGFVHGTRAALRSMRTRDSGVIVQVSSALAFRGIPLQSAYCGAKHAIDGFTDSLRSELLHDRSRIRLVGVHLPAVNTPQFDHCRSRLDRRAQPVPPIFEPEACAAAIVDAIGTAPRDVWVGFSTIKTIAGHRLGAPLLDRYLARNGFDAQQTSEPEDPEREDNLFKPLAGDPGARGRFHDTRSVARTFTWRHVGAAITGAVLGATGAAMLRRRLG